MNLKLSICNAYINNPNDGKKPNKEVDRAFGIMPVMVKRHYTAAHMDLYTLQRR